ncbi:hypothetical protein GCM10020367_20630 [Streptomyces sannanensis]|uniref:Uncharacterized protein n=1 Tax=Streptomyces sannanensis TaxID=285536 RepID=A0ABP6S9C3_9ACTN
MRFPITRLRWRPFALTLQDEPHPDCASCSGTGDASETYAGPPERHPGIIDCPCFTPGRIIPLRLRLRIATADSLHGRWDRPALVLTDTPRPACTQCRGEGGWNEDHGHPETGEYDGTEWIICPCWEPNVTWRVLPLPHRSRRPSWPVSDEPPF